MSGRVSVSTVKPELQPSARAERNWRPGPWPIPPSLAGTAVITPDGPVQAGSWQSFEIVYTAGRFGIDDSGSLKLCFRFATDQSRLQVDHPAKPGYVTVEASNGAVLETRFDPKQNVRPWDRTLHVKVIRGFMREGDRLTIRIGDRRQGSPGIRAQTFAEPHFEFHVLVDPIACYHFVPVEQQPAIAVIGGPRDQWVAVLPSTVAVGEPFSLRIRSDDCWGNPASTPAARLTIRPSLPVAGLPDRIELEEGSSAFTIDGIVVEAPGILRIDICDAQDERLCGSNPSLVEGQVEERLYWADFHAQSGETIGTNAAEDYFRFARDLAFLDIVGHQGNDFQITAAIWDRLNRLFDAYDQAGRFVALPGYEWSGNTALGGDRNVFFRQSGRTIRRSSHALVPDMSDAADDCHTAAELFEALRRDGEDVITFAHVGGRYADIGIAHEPKIETAVEVHSSWGTFEWIVHDAFDLGYRVGIVANSDGHKGRPGAEGPGASMFGAYGGLTCLQMPELSRDATFEALRARRHYATTGSRMLLDVQAAFDGETLAFDADPVLGPCGHRPAGQVPMGAIVHTTGSQVRLNISVCSDAPIERIEIRNGREIVDTRRPYRQADLGRRIRVVWSGAEYRGRFRMTEWDGRASLSGNAFENASPINFFNRDRTLDRLENGDLSWRSITTGNFSGFDAMLASPAEGSLELETAQGRVVARVDEIGISPLVFPFGGLDRKIEIYRTPDVNRHRAVTVDCKVPLDPARDNPLYVSVVTEDGHQAWSSPVYAIPKPAWL